MKKLLSTCFFAFFFLLLTDFSLGAEESAPSFDFEAKPHETVHFVAYNWHPKDYGWLLTFRLTAPSRYSIRPITHLRFEGLDEAEEVVWEKSRVVRRDDMDSSLGSGESLFVRVMFEDVPESVTLVKMSFDDGLGEDEE